MGEHRFNPVAQANAVPQQRVRVMDLGDGIALAGISLEPMRNNEGGFAIAVVATGGRMSELVPLQPVRVVIGMLPVMPLEAIKALLDGKEPPPPADPCGCNAKHEGACQSHLVQTEADA